MLLKHQILDRHFIYLEIIYAHLHIFFPKMHKAIGEKGAIIVHFCCFDN